MTRHDPDPDPPAPRGTGEPAPPAESIGALCVAGDWACVHGDLPALESLATRLALRVPEPLHCELVALAALCRARAEEAVPAWMTLKERLFPGGEPPR